MGTEIGNDGSRILLLLTQIEFQLLFLGGRGKGGEGGGGGASGTQSAISENCLPKVFHETCVVICILFLIQKRQSFEFWLFSA